MLSSERIMIGLWLPLRFTSVGATIGLSVQLTALMVNLERFLSHLNSPWFIRPGGMWEVSHFVWPLIFFIFWSRIELNWPPTSPVYGIYVPLVSCASKILNSTECWLKIKVSLLQTIELFLRICKKWQLSACKRSKNNEVCTQCSKMSIF